VRRARRHRRSTSQPDDGGDPERLAEQEHAVGECDRRDEYVTRIERRTRVAEDRELEEVRESGAHEAFVEMVGGSAT
jgi:hypothetical protein